MRLEYIYSAVPAKRIDDLDIAVGMDEGEVTIDIRLVTGRGRPSTRRPSTRPSRWPPRRPKRSWAKKRDLILKSKEKEGIQCFRVYRTRTSRSLSDRPPFSLAAIKGSPRPVYICYTHSTAVPCSTTQLFNNLTAFDRLYILLANTMLVYSIINVLLIHQDKSL